MKLYVATYTDGSIHIFAGATELDAHLAANELGRAKDCECDTKPANTTFDELLADVQMAQAEAYGR